MFYSYNFSLNNFNKIFIAKMKLYYEKFTCYLKKYKGNFNH